jgi:amidase
MSPLGMGNDIGGSLRNPAYACGICSIKPSAQRVPSSTTTEPGTPMIASQLMLVQGLLARRVADLRTGLGAIIGADPRDPYCISAPLEGPRTDGPLRVALVPEPAGGSTDPSVAEGVRRAGGALQEAGYLVDEVAPPMLETAYLTWSALLLGELTLMRPILEMALSEDALRFLDYGTDAFGIPDAAAMSQTHQARLEVAMAWARFMDEYPLIVGPTWTQKPFEHGFDVASYDNSLATLELMRFVLPQNLLGIPAACVPVGMGDQMPAGVQITGRRFREDQCLEAAQAIEDVLGILTPIDPR